MTESTLSQPVGTSATMKPSLVHQLPSRHQQFVVENGIMPVREVHIMAAASGVGKTTLMVQILDDLIEGNLVFDSPAHPVRPVYLCNDRSRDDILRTFERVAPKHEYPVYSLLTDAQFSHCSTPEASIRMAKTMHPEIDFVVYDPISFNVENINSSREVSGLLRRLTKIAQELNLTVLIIHHTAKAKADAGYASPRQKISGSAAWGGYSNLNLILEEAEESDPTNPLRTLHVCPRNGANRSFNYMQDEAGCFVPAPTDEDDPTRQRATDDKTFNALPDGDVASYQLFKACGKKSKGALDRNIKRWIMTGALEKISRGKFLKIHNVR